MWDTKRIIKRVFSRVYTNIYNIKEILTNSKNKFINPKLFIGSGFIGGGIMGTSINIQSKIEDNIIDITINNKDHYIEKVESKNITYSYSGGYKEILDCFSIQSKGNLIIISFKGETTSGGTPLPPIILILTVNGVKVQDFLSCTEFETRKITIILILEMSIWVIMF